MISTGQGDCNKYCSHYTLQKFLDRDETESLLQECPHAPGQVRETMTRPFRGE